MYGGLYPLPHHTLRTRKKIEIFIDDLLVTFNYAYRPLRCSCSLLLKAVSQNMNISMIQKECKLQSKMDVFFCRKGTEILQQLAMPLN